MTVIEHLQELRRVLIVSLIATMILAVASYYYSQQAMAILLAPVTNLGYKMIFTNVTEAFFTRIKLSLFLGFLAALPVILWQLWGFVMPALEKRGKIYFTLFTILSLLCFAGGILFGFFVVYPSGVKFLLQFGGMEFIPMLTIGKYVSFTIWLLLPFGLIFEFPLASFFLAQMGFLSYRFLRRNNKYAILLIVVAAAILTPTPDNVTCLLMAGQMYLLYLFSAGLVRLVERARLRKERRNSPGSFLVPKQSSDNEKRNQFPGPRLQYQWLPFWYTF